MKKLLVVLLLFAWGASKTQTIEIANQQFLLAEIDSILTDSVDLEYVDVDVYLTRSRRVPGLDSTVTSSFNIPIPLVRRAELQNIAFNTIWNIESKFANAEMTLLSEDDIETSLVDVVNPILVELTGEDYPDLANNRFLDRFRGYYQMEYDFNGNGQIGSAEKINIMINPDTIPNLFEVHNVTDTSGTFIEPLPGGETGRMIVLNVNRLELRNLIPGDNRVKVSRNPGESIFYRKENLVRLRFLRNDIQQIPFRHVP